MATKTDLVRFIAKSCEVTQDKASGMIDAFMDCICDCMEKGESVGLTGYFSITPTFKPEHEARNPQTGKMIKVPGKYRIVMKAGNNLKNAANKVK